MKVFEKSLWGVALSRLEIMTNKHIKELEKQKAELAEEIEKYCITQGAVSEKQRIYYRLCLHPLRKEYNECDKQLKTALRKLT